MKKARQDVTWVRDTIRPTGGVADSGVMMILTERYRKVHEIVPQDDVAMMEMGMGMEMMGDAGIGNRDGCCLPDGEGRQGRGGREGGRARAGDFRE